MPFVNAEGLLMYMVIQEPGTLSQTKTPLSSTLLELEEDIFVFWGVSAENRWFWITSRSFGNQANTNSWQPCLAGDRRESIHVAYRSHWPFYPSSDVCFLCPRHLIFCSLYLELCYWCSRSSRRGAYRYQWSLHTYKHLRFRNSKWICTFLRNSGFKVIKYCMLLLIVATWGCWDLEG